MSEPTGGAAKGPVNFIRHMIEGDLASGKHKTVVTRFPPEPNGYLHIGHAKSICLNFGLAAQYPGGRCHLRFDDTNPATEDVEYVDSIKADIRWLGFDWGTHEYYASDYYEKLYEFAVALIRAGLAYVDELSAEELRAHRGTLTEPGRESPNRSRPIAENLDLFARMRAGEFPDGSRILRAKIDMASPNINMRDPAIYRIRRMSHHRTGDKWCIYPLYDYTHCLSDMLEAITHSICTLEFEDHRPLYDWVLDVLKTPCHPQQIEFARLNLDYTVMSKRRLLSLVKDKHVDGWDDPRMPTLVGFRRRGYTPEAIRDFCERIGVTKKESVIELSTLENSIREDLDRRAPRAMAVLRPLKVVIENYPEGQVEDLDAANHPKDPSMGTRKVPFSRTLYIERDDFMETPAKGFFRLAPGQEVRLRFAYFVRCVGVSHDPRTGEVSELRCTYDPATRGGDAPDGRKVKGTIHWVSADRCVTAEVRLYDRLFTVPSPGDDDFVKHLNPKSLEILKDARLEPALVHAEPESRWQFERLGYFVADMKDSKLGRPVFNRVVTLRDTWAKEQKR